MATVYLAEDVRHRRKVAVKVLRPELAAALGPERFLKEIEIAAQLQHPHILPLHDSGEADGFLFYVMPYVEGQSLRDRLAKGGELPVAAAVRILRDVADALSAAHAHGVVHRDIKPDNVMLSGRHALVTDFGVAKAVSHATVQRGPTTAGVSLGTPAYMAPEQAVADPHVDHRADIYAFGVLAYEILTGEPPFTGETQQEVLSAHLTTDPTPIADRRASVAPQLAQLIMRCLEKKPADRWQSAEELVPQLETLTTPGAGVTPSTTRPVVGLSRRQTWVSVGIAAAVIVGAVVAWAMLGRTRGGAPADVMAAYTQVTFVGDVSTAAISPDGRQLAYVAPIRDTARLFVKDLDGGTPLEIGTVRGASSPEWSPDGSRILVTVLEWPPDESGILAPVRRGYIFPRLGGPPQRLDSRLYAIWSPDGSRVATWDQGGGPSLPLSVIDVGSSDTSSIALPDSLTEFAYAGSWSPTGSHIAVPRSSGHGVGRLWTVAVDGSGHELVVEASSGIFQPRWAPAAEAIYYLSEGHLWRVPVSPESGAAEGPARLLQRDLGVLPLRWTASLSVTSDGRRAAYVKATGHSNLWRATFPQRGGVRAVGTTAQVTTGTAAKACAAVSPDAQAIAFVERDDLYRVPIDGGAAERMTFSGTVWGCPAWSPDGGSLAFATRVGAVRKVAVVSSSGGTPRIFEKTVVGGPGGKEVAWAPGRRILYHVPGNRNFRLLDPDTQDEEPLVTNDSVGWMFSPTYSPDGTRVAVVWNRPRSGAGVWVISLEDSSQVMLRVGWTYQYGWSEDGESIYVRESDEFRLVPLAGGAGTVAAHVPFEDANCTPVERPTGLTLVCMVSEATSDVWIMENFDPALARR